MMKSRGLTGGILLAGLASGIAAGDIERIKAEPKLEKRAELALKNADLMVDVGRDAYLKGEGQDMVAALDELRVSVDLCYASLKATGKDPRKSYKHYKRAEMGTRKLLRRLQTFRDEMSVDDREPVESTIKHVDKVHEDLLHAIMGGAK